MAKDTVKPVEASVTEEVKVAEPPKTVPFEEYEKLYNSAVALEARYNKLLQLYDTLIEQYLSGK